MKNKMRIYSFQIHTEFGDFDEVYIGISKKDARSLAWHMN